MRQAFLFSNSMTKTRPSYSVTGAPSPERRNVVKWASASLMAIGVLPLSACSGSNEDPNRLIYDLNSPQDTVDIYVKMVGDLSGGRNYLQYETDVTLIRSHETPKIMYKVRGIARADWTKIGPQNYKQKNFDHGLICDAKTGLVVDEYLNPITNEINQPIHYRSGPFETSLTPENEKIQSLMPSWRQVSGALWSHETSAGARENWLQPDKWPKASTGKDVHFGVSSTYIAEIAFLNDKNLTSAPMTHIWGFSTPFPPWMLMGNTQGTLVWNWIARKVPSFEELDPYLVAEIEKRWPNYFEAGDPWREKINGWTHYEQEREPVLK